MLKKRGALLSFAIAMYSAREDDMCVSVFACSPEKDCITLVYSVWMTFVFMSR